MVVEDIVNLARLRARQPLRRATNTKQYVTTECE